MSGTPFRDFIPAGEELNAQGDGFKDFVPTPQPVFHPEVEEVKSVETPITKPVEKKKTK